MIARYILLTLVYTLCASQIHAQKLPFTNYTTANGLQHNRTHVIRQDAKGYIWVGTSMGINRFDGRTFKTFPYPGIGYRASREAGRYGDSVIFCVDYYGIAICCGDSVRFVELKGDNIAGVCGIVRINDTTFYATNLPNGLYTIKGNRTEHILMPTPINNDWNLTAMYKDRRANVWLSTAGGLIFFPKGDLSDPLRISYFDKREINFVTQDKKNGDIYISAINGVFRYDESQCSSIQNEQPREKLGMLDHITALVFDTDHNIWMSSSEQGIYKYNAVTKVQENYSLSGGLVCQIVWDVFCDKENNIWAATENGISKLSTQGFYAFDFTKTDYQNVRGAIKLGDSALLFSNMLNVYVYKNSSITKVQGYKNVLGYIEDLLLKAPDGRFFADINTAVPGMSFNVNTYAYDLKNNSFVNGRKLNSLPGGPERIYIEHGVVKEGQDMWVHTNRGIQRYNNGIFSAPVHLVLKGKKLSISHISGNNKGDLWVIDKYRELIRYSKTATHVDSVPYTFTQQQYIASDQLKQQRLNKIFIDSKQNIWLCGRENGMYYLPTDKDGNVTAIDTAIAQKFSSKLINDIIEDADHNLWVGTAEGLDKVTRNGSGFEVEKDLYQTELCGKYIFFLKLLGNKLCVGTTGCMEVIDISYHEPKVPPVIYITGLKVNERNAKLLLGTRPELKPNENVITFTYTGLGYKDERNILYSYKLEGLDEQWSDPQKEYSITYSRIPPGTYTFKVRAFSAHGGWSAQAALFTFTIARPFYTTWWFILLIAAVVFAVVYSIYRYRIDQVFKIERIRQTISKDLHDDIGATVSSINILATMANSDLVSDFKRNQFLETIQHESKHVSESLNDIVWSITPKNDSLEIMFARMQRYASELFDAENIAYEFKLPGMPLKDTDMEMAKRQHVYLIFKEAVNNLVKYAKATTAEVTFAIARSEFTMVIADNGKGFDTTIESNGNGMFNMNRRANDIKAKLAITSTPGKGTTITLTMSV